MLTPRPLEPTAGEPHHLDATATYDASVQSVEDQPVTDPITTHTENPAVLTVGVFDGVHLGHQALVERASRIAEEHQGGARVVALAFDPAPAAVLAPGREPPRLTTFEDRADLLLDAGADEVLRLEPTPGLLGLSPEAFVDYVLMPLRPIAVVEGPDFCFGAKRAGDVRTLAELGRQRGFRVEVVEPIEGDLDDQTMVPARSTRVRWLLEHGRVADAGRVLGRAYELAGEVLRGDQRGRTIGFPTANIRSEVMVPGDGVYACFADLGDGRAVPAAVNVGDRPTFDGIERRVEAHLIGFEPSAGAPEYEWSLRLAFVSRLRDQVRFGLIEDLKAQLDRDVARAAELLDSTEHPWIQEHVTA